MCKRYWNPFQQHLHRELNQNILNMHSFIKHLFILLMMSLMAGIPARAQGKLKPGFDAKEYGKLLGTTLRQSKQPWKENMEIPYPEGFELAYRSPVVGLDNRWDLWLSEDHVAIINVRGTTAKTNSWLEDFYAGMVPATGYIETRQHDKFHYKLADHADAAVHAGWLTGMASIAPGIIVKINEYYDKGVKDFLIMGHSQGAAIVYLLDSYLHYDVDNKIPDDITFKTYNSAAPKPGNLYYAYDYEYINRGGWAFRVVNTVDWVPESPVSVQTLDDFSEVNPFKDLDTFTSSMGWLERVVVRSVFRKIDRSLNKAQKKLLKYLGFKMYTFVEDYMPGMAEPTYVETMNYSPAGTAIILPATEKYLNEYVKTRKPSVFVNHYTPAYYFLLKEHYLK
jgi:hypothetical protein